MQSPVQSPGFTDTPIVLGLGLARCVPGETPERTRIYMALWDDSATSILDRCLSIVRGEPEQANMAHACENDCMGRYM